MNEKKLSIGRIFWTDYATFASLVAELLSLGFILYDSLIQKTDPGWLPSVARGAIIATLGVMVWRVRLIKSAFDDGWMVEGEIVGVSFFRDRGRVTYLYTIQGERYQSSNAVMQHRITRQLMPGQKVAIFANKDNPKLAFIYEIYS